MLITHLKTNSTLLKLVNKNLLCHTCERRRQHMRVRRPLKRISVQHLFSFPDPCGLTQHSEYMLSRIDPVLLFLILE